jgi:hypothetical protein
MAVGYSDDDGRGGGMLMVTVLVWKCVLQWW